LQYRIKDSLPEDSRQILKYCIAGHVSRVCDGDFVINESNSSINLEFESKFDEVLVKLSGIPESFNKYIDFN